MRLGQSRRRQLQRGNWVQFVFERKKDVYCKEECTEYIEVRMLRGGSGIRKKLDRLDPVKCSHKASNYQSQFQSHHDPMKNLIQSSSCLQIRKTRFRSDQIRSVVQSCLTLCDPMNCSMPGPPVHHQLVSYSMTWNNLKKSGKVRGLGESGQ